PPLETRAPLYRNSLTEREFHARGSCREKDYAEQGNFVQSCQLIYCIQIVDYSEDRSWGTPFRPLFCIKCSLQYRVSHFDYGTQSGEPLLGPRTRPLVREHGRRTGWGPEHCPGSVDQMLDRSAGAPGGRCRRLP